MGDGVGLAVVGGEVGDRVVGGGEGGGVTTSCEFQEVRSKTGLGVGGGVGSNTFQPDTSRMALVDGCDVGRFDGGGDGGFVGCF